MQRMQSTASMARLLGFAPPLITEPPPPGPQSPPAKAKRFAADDDPAAARSGARLAPPPPREFIKGEGTNRKSPSRRWRPAGRPPAAAAVARRLARAGAAPAVTKSAGARGPLLDGRGAGASRTSTRAASRGRSIAEALKRVQRRRLETLAAVAAQRRPARFEGPAQGGAATVLAALRRRRRGTIMHSWAPVSIETARRRRVARAVLHTAAPGFTAPPADARARRFRTRAEAWRLTAQRVLRGRRGRRVAPRGDVGARVLRDRARFSASLCPFASRRRATAAHATPAQRQGVRALVFLLAPGHEAREAPAAAAQRWWRLLVHRWRWRACSVRGAGRSSPSRARAARGCGETPRGPRGAPRFRSGAATTPSALFRRRARRRSCCGCSPPSAATRRRRRRPPPFPDEDDGKECPMSPRRCIKCGDTGRVPMASTDGLCVECIN